MPVRIQEIRDRAGLQAIRADWEALWRHVRHATPFSSPAWLLPWCQHLGDPGFDPWAVACWRDGALEALLPGFVYQDGRGRVLGLLGGGVSDYQDALVADDIAARTLLEHLARRGDRFDVADLRALPHTSKLLAAAAAADLQSHGEADAVGAVLALPPRFEDLGIRTSRGLLHDVQYQRRRLAREGGLSVARVRSGEELDGALDVLFRLHGARWEARGERGVLADPAVQRFHRAAARDLLGAGLLRLMTLRVGGSPIASSYGMTAHGRSYVYLFGTEPGAARRSPGALAVGQAIEDAISEGADELDFLRGDEPYKLRWGAVRRSTTRLRLLPRRIAAVPETGRFPGCERDAGVRARWPWSS